MTDELLAGQPNRVDRTGWPKGVWNTEPDRVDWKTAAGFPAIALRHTSGHWCGYVAVPPGHPLFPVKDRSGDESEYDDAVQVHGGVTYSGFCGGHVCHVAGPGEPSNVFWLGFDFAHLGDASPGSDADPKWTKWSSDGRTAYWGPKASYCRGEVKGVYRELAYVRDQCERVGRQLATIAAEAA